jgi:hypothetical protein
MHACVLAVFFYECLVRMNDRVLERKMRERREWTNERVKSEECRFTCNA